MPCHGLCHAAPGRASPVGPSFHPLLAGLPRESGPGGERKRTAVNKNGRGAKGRGRAAFIQQLTKRARFIAHGAVKKNQ